MRGYFPIEGARCPLCGSMSKDGEIESVRATKRYVVFRCARCWRKFRGPFQNDKTDEEFAQAVTQAAHRKFAPEIVARKFMETG